MTGWVKGKYSDSKHMCDMSQVFRILVRLSDYPYAVLVHILHVVNAHPEQCQCDNMKAEENVKTVSPSCGMPDIPSHKCATGLFMLNFLGFHVGQ